jgi:UDP-N-acetylmuramoylalanine--D-glutamate ligase
MSDEQYSPAARARLAGLAGRRVGIVGLAREGIDLANFLHSRGAQVVVSDQASVDSLEPALQAISNVPADLRLGHQEPEDLLDCDEIFVSPGVPREIPLLAWATARGILFSSATRLFFELCPGPIAAITGSSGKTTTTSLVGAMLERAGIPHIVGGNIGRPMLARLDELTTKTWSVLELSSFQLDDIAMSPQVGAVLNITPNHLDRHPDMADYIRAKGNLVRYQGVDDVAVLNADEPNSAGLPHASQSRWFSLTGPVAGAWFDGARVWLANHPNPLVERHEIPLRGIHNVANVLAASLIAEAVGCPPAALQEAIRAFQAVPHRLEIVASVEGVTYINDSIATSPERSMAALRAIDEPVVLIAGGRDKHLPMEEWAEEIGRRARAVILVGEAAPLIDHALEAAAVTIPRARASRFADTVGMARELAQPGDVVLLSPGCTSFDEFRDFEARGEAFRATVRELAGEKNWP